FVDDDGACRPSLAKCPLGSVPDVDTGCVPVGVPDCAEAFIDSRGLCLPAESDCDAGSFPVPSLGCVPIDGDAGCGTGTWGNVPDAAENIYVDASFVGTSDGSIDLPFASLTAALAAAASGSRIVLAAGTYSVDAPLTSGVELRGVCASQVTLTAADDAVQVLSLSAPAGETIIVSDVTVSASVDGIRVFSGDAEIRRAVIRDVHHKAVEVGGTGTTALLERVLVRDTTLGGNADVGIGVQALSGAEVTVRESALVRTHTVALQAYGGALGADDVFVAETLADPSGHGNGAAGQAGGVLTLKRSVFRESVGGVYVGAETTIEDCVLGTVLDPVGDKITMTDGELVLRRTAAVDGDTWGITVYEGTPGPVVMEHLLMADIGSGEYGGSGISLAEPATVRRSTFTRNLGPSITAVKNTQLDGVVVEETFTDTSVGLGAGIVALDGGLISIHRSYLRDVEDAALLVGENSGGAGTVSLSRSRIEALPGIDGFGGIGVGINAPNVTVTIEHTVIDDVHAVGVLSADTSVTIESSVVRSVAPNNVNLLVPESADVGPIADGVMFVGTEEHGLTLNDVWIEAAERVGVTLAGGTHALTGVHASGASVGLALRDGAVATQDGCDFTENTLPTEDPSDVVVPAP
ncbi:MAG: hypothetical protein JNK04_07595, partial [Myxococcales bacterium]|nr:hypothetical protein [Myxococcales bacterium]